jgi:hypothetical protein
LEGRKSLSESSAGSSEKEEAEKRLSEQLEKNRIQIVTKLDELNQLNQTLKKDYVPISVINNLSQSIKEVEVKQFFILNRKKLMQSFK